MQLRSLEFNSDHGASLLLGLFMGFSSTRETRKIFVIGLH